MDAMSNLSWKETIDKLNEGKFIYYEERDESGYRPPGIIRLSKYGELLPADTPFHDTPDIFWEVGEGEGNEKFNLWIPPYNKPSSSAATLQELYNHYKHNYDTYFKAFYNAKEIKTGGRRIKRKVTKKKTKRSRKSRVKRA